MRAKCYWSRHRAKRISSDQLFPVLYGQVGHAGGAAHLVTASLDGTIAVCGGATKGSGRGDGVLQRLQVRFGALRGASE